MYVNCPSYFAKGPESGRTGVAMNALHMVRRHAAPPLDMIVARSAMTCSRTGCSKSTGVAPVADLAASRPDDARVDAARFPAGRPP